MNAPKSIADMLAAFAPDASMSAPPAPAPMPSPMPMAPAAPPSGGGGGNNFGAQMQKALPMLMALMARKQGGPEAGAGLLEGYARGQMQRRQAEQDALELELQTTENAEAKAVRRAEFDRKRLMERESWVRNLRDELAKINDPEQFASTLATAEKWGAPLYGISPGELKQQFTFPDSRVAEAAKTRAQARIDALRKANPNNFDDMLRANAIDRATGKPLQELMATAELLVTDQAGAPMLPTPKDEFQIPNSDAGFDFRVELAAEEERLGRKLKPGERSALRRRLVGEEEARLRGRRAPRGGGSGGSSGGESGSSGGAGATSSGSFIDEIMENPAIYHDMGEVDKRKYRQALSRRGFTAWQKPSGAAGAAGGGGATAGASPYMRERNLRNKESVDALVGQVSGWTAGAGSLLARIPGSAARDFAAELDTLKANIAFGELTAMREASKTGGALGAVSERELALLTATLGALDAGQSPANLKEQLLKIKASIERWEAAVDAAASAAPPSGAGARGRGAGPGPNNGPKVGDIKTYPNGNKARWDGQGWELIKQ